MSKRVSNRKGKKGGSRSSKTARRRRGKSRLSAAQMEWQTEQLAAKTLSAKMMREVQEEAAKLERSFGNRMRKLWSRIFSKASKTSLPSAKDFKDNKTNSTEQGKTP